MSVDFFAPCTTDWVENRGCIHSVISDKTDNTRKEVKDIINKYSDQTDIGENRSWDPTS